MEILLLPLLKRRKVSWKYVDVNGSIFGEEIRKKSLKTLEFLK
jgi:hypothetical protein